MKKIFIVIGILLGSIMLGSFLFLNYLWNEDRDYALNRKMLDLTHALKVYKQKHGMYPKSITAVQSSENLCVTFLYPTCTHVYYQTFDKSQNFHLAMKSFSWVILWYDERYCFDDRYDTYPEQIRRTQPIWFFCAAAPASHLGSPFPTYRKDKVIFANPSDWPDIK